MPIDPTRPLDGVNAVKADLRSNLQAASDGIRTADSANSGTAITVNAASFGDHALVRIRCTATSAISVTLANDVPVGRALEVVRYGATGDVTVVAGSGATLIKPPSATVVTTERYEAMVFEVDTNTGTNAAWRLLARP